MLTFSCFVLGFAWRNRVTVRCLLQEEAATCAELQWSLPSLQRLKNNVKLTHKPESSKLSKYRTLFTKLLLCPTRSDENNKSQEPSITLYSKTRQYAGHL